MGCYVIKYKSDQFILKEDTNIDSQVSKSGELDVRATYLSESKTKTNWYC